MCADTGTLLLQTAAGMSMNLSASHLCPPPPLKLMTASPHLRPIMTRMLRQLKMFTPVAKKGKKCSSMLHKVACFHFDGIANQSGVIYVCLELEMSPGCDIGGGPTLLGAAKPYGEFTHCIYSQSNRLETE